MNKKVYLKPCLEIVVLADADIICTSDTATFSVNDESVDNPGDYDKYFPGWGEQW